MGQDIKRLKQLLEHTERYIPKCRTGLMKEQAVRIRAEIAQLKAEQVEPKKKTKKSKKA